MQLLNFELDRDGISLNWQGPSLDLHSCYDFGSLHYDLRTQQAALTWRRSPEE